ncbi:MAG: TfoX/Sxy family protein [Rickettsiales bacterium]|jgi:TfoX/Sxy family transcriptional regulator of competence genes|nr:TfoX/Sxy family protein [Rickettsiales bacterium]
MASDKDFIDFAVEQVAAAGDISARKMFGDFMIYCDAKPALLVCDNTPFVKILPETTELFARLGASPEKGVPYKGAKEHYILDIENADAAVEMMRLLARILPLPKPRKKKS